MNLIDNMMENFILLDKIRTPDGEDGFITQWKEGATFKAVATLDTTMEAKIAEVNGVTSVYKVTTHRKTALNYNDYIKRESDGAVFRITTRDEKKSPAVSGLDIARFDAERTEMPT